MGKYGKTFAVYYSDIKICVFAPASREAVEVLEQFRCRRLCQHSERPFESNHRQLKQRLIIDITIGAVVPTPYYDPPFHRSIRTGSVSLRLG
jgi:hypothetical protein